MLLSGMEIKSKTRYGPRRRIGRVRVYQNQLANETNRCDAGSGLTNMT